MELLEKALKLKDEGLKAINEAKDLASLESAYNAYLSKKGEVSLLMGEMRNVANQDKAAFGKSVNETRSAIQTAYDEKKVVFEEEELNKRLEKEKIDITLPGMNAKQGNINPFYLIIDEVISIFTSMGFDVFGVYLIYWVPPPIGSLTSSVKLFDTTNPL